MRECYISHAIGSAEILVAVRAVDNEVEQWNGLDDALTNSVLWVQVQGGTQSSLATRAREKGGRERRVVSEVGRNLAACTLAHQLTIA